MENTKVEIANAKIEYQNLQRKDQDVRKEIIKLKDELTLLDEEKGQILRQALPEGEDILSLTAFLEEYALAYNSNENPLLIENISFGKSKFEKDYFSIPLRLKVTASEANMKNFIDLIERSGSLEEENFYKNKPIRLMVIESINLRLPQKSNNSDDKIITGDFEIFTYFTGTEKDLKSAKQK